MRHNWFLIAACIACGAISGGGAKAEAKAGAAVAKPAKAPAGKRKKAPAKVAVVKTSMPAVGFDPEFAVVLAQVLDNSPAVAAAKTDATAAGVDLRAIRWRRLPTLSVSGSYYGVQGDAPKRLNPNVSVDLVLWNAGRIKGDIERAKASKRAAEARLLGAQLDASLVATSLFYELKRLSERTGIIQRNLNELQSMQDGMSRRVSQEVSPRSDLELAMTRTLQVKLILEANLAQRRIILQRLREQLQDDNWQPLDRRVEIGAKLTSELDDVVGLAEEFDPQRMRLEAEAAIAQADAKATAAGRFPSVSAQYSYDQIYGHRVGLAVKGQTNGLSEFGLARAAALRQTAADQRIDIAERDIRAAVTADYVDYTSAFDRLDLVENAAATTNGVRDSYVRQFVSGKRTWLDVMNAMREAMSAQLDAVDVRYMAAQAQVRLMIRMGNMPIEAEGQK